MNDLASCLYLGEVVHRRFAPRDHRLRYRLFQGFFDLDELPELGRRLRVFSHNGRNLVSFHDRDHGDGAAAPLRAYVETQLARAGLSGEGGPIRLLCMPRILGFVFNPLSIFYCYGPDERLRAILYEVNNTFGERHSYLIPVERPGGDVIRQACAKDFFVSPFMDMEMAYAFRVSLPGPRLATSIDGTGRGGERLIFASFTGRRRELTDMTLLWALAAYPLMTLGVVAAIHWEAAKLFIKGLRLRARPAPPPPVTVVHKMDKQSA